MDKYYTVSQINSYIKMIFQNDSKLSRLWILGEISNFKLHTTGHMYFTLKDEGGIIRSVMFKSKSFSLKFRPEDGMKVLAFGNLSVYEKDGSYQLYVEAMEEFGLGSLHIAFEKLKEKLTKEGLFAKEKKALPLLPKAIGVISSSTGSVIRDIVNVTYRRFPRMKIYLFPVSVQGERASYQIEEAINLANNTGLVDLLILARGGGSIEDLWAFNEERTVRAIYDSALPLISAIGHETDFTLSDFVADLRAATPSQAAEFAIPELYQLEQKLEAYRGKIRAYPLASIEIKQKDLDRLKNSASFTRPYDRIERENMYLAKLVDRLISSYKLDHVKKKNSLLNLTTKLEAIDPNKVLERGYSLVRKKADQSIIKSIEDIDEGAYFEVIVRDGSFDGIRVGEDISGKKD